MNQGIFFHYVSDDRICANTNRKLYVVLMTLLSDLFRRVLEFLVYFDE